MWEDGHAQPLVDRAMLLLTHACPDESRDDLAALPVGRRDARLMTLREWTFGPSLSSLVACPACGERLELNFTVTDLRVTPPAGDGVLTVQAHGYEVIARLPDSTDLATLEVVGDGRRHLLHRCVQRAYHKGKKRSFSRLPARVLDAVVQSMSEADPQANVQTTLTCRECAHTWQAAFDVVSFFWEELEHWAHRTLRDVHILASAYGWDEADILRLSPLRRQCYLQLVPQ